MKQKNLFWGGILVTLGVLFILKNLEIVYFNWWSILSLWPVLLVLLGVIMLPIKNSIKTFLTIIILGTTIALIFTRTDYYDRNYRWYWHYGDRWDEWDSNDKDYNDEEQNDNYFYEPFEAGIKEATLNIDAASGEFIIEDASTHLLEFDQKGNVGPYIFSTNKNGNHQNLTINIEKRRYFKRKKLRNSVKLKLNEEPVWNFNVNTGAASIDLDLTRFKTKTIDIDDGASEVNIKLGSKYNRTSVNIDSGVSSIEIRVPKESGCEIDTDTFLSSKSFKGFSKVRGGLYQTENFGSAENKIYINIDVAISSLEVIRY